VDALWSAVSWTLLRLWSERVTVKRRLTTGMGGFILWMRHVDESYLVGGRVSVTRCRYDFLPSVSNRGNTVCSEIRLL
jgi:hypothetical protein